MDVERLLIAKIVAERNYNDVYDAGVGIEHFDHPMNRKLFKLIQEFKVSYGEVPTEDVLQKDYPTVTLPDCSEYSMEYLLDEIRRDRLSSILSEGMMEASGLVSERKPEEGLDLLAHAVREGSQQSRAAQVMDLTAMTTDAWADELNERRKREGWLLGVPSGFDALDRATQGFQRQQLITFVGLPKSGKSTLLLLAAMSAHQVAHVPLFVGFEMSNDEQRYRHAAFLAGLSHQQMLTGNISKADRRKLDRAIRALSAMPPFLLASDVRSATTITGLQTLIEQHDPGIVYVDGVYMMRDEEGEDPNSSRALTNITRGLKRMAQTLDIPVVLTTQALTARTGRGQSLTADSVGYSSSFRQDSDVLIGVEKTEIDDINKVSILDARNAKRMSVYIRWDWDSGTFEELDEDPFKQQNQATLDAQSGY